MVVIEVLQLTGIPLAMRQSANKIAYYISIALGTKFSLSDIVAYVVGIVFITGVETWFRVDKPV